jgi:hypothetical protein
LSATLRIYDTDGSTVITTLTLGNITSPGASSDKKIYVNNFGDQTAQSVTLAIVAVGTNDGSLYAYTAPDSGGSPGTFAQTTLSLGNITAGSSIAVWTRANLVSNLTADGNPRRYNLLASGTTI